MDFREYSLFLVCITLIAISTPSTATEDLAMGYEEYPGSTHNARAQPLASCPQTTYQFPNGDQTRNYLRLKTPVPNLKEFTTCFWMSRVSKGHDPWISYHDGDTANAFLVATYRDELQLHINNKGSVVSFPLSINTDYHVCIASRSSTTGKHYAFLNGDLHQVFHHTPGTIKGGGIFITGQEQDTIAGGFVATESLQGKISNLAMWDRILDQNEIMKMYRNRCLCPPDSILSLEINNVDMFGGVSTHVTGKC